MKRLLILTLLLLTFILSSSAAAQAAVVFETVQIQFWPEYDQPAMLVIYTFELSPDQPLPVEITVRIPTRVGEPTAVAILEDNRLLTQGYSQEVAGEWSEITVLAETPVVHLEYYDPMLSQDDPQREFLFEWSFDYAINNLIISAKQPANSQGFTLQPDLGAGQADQDGLLTYVQDLGSLAAGEVFSFEMGYTRSVNTLAAAPPSAFPEEPAQPVSVTGPFSDLDPWMWALIGGGVILVIVGGVYFVRNSRQSKAPSKYRQKKERASAVRSSGKTAGFCHQCGTSARLDDKFCRECGAKLRK